MSVASTSSLAARHRPYGSLVSNGRALREIESASFLERHLGTHEAQLTIIDAGFTDLEEEFIEERRAIAVDPYYPSVEVTHDELMLQIRRNDLAGQMIRESRRRFHAYITKRSKMPLELPPVVDMFREEVGALVEMWERAHE